MKTKRLVLTLLTALVTAGAQAETGGTGAGVHYIKAPRFARQLVEKWIEEYAKIESGAHFEIAKGQADLQLVVGDNDGSHVVYFAGNAVLPITARGSEAARVLDGKHLSSKKLRQLYFLGDDLEEDTKRNKQFERLVVYSGSNASSVAAAFARNFGEQSSTFRGKRIAGDDLFLNTALAKDPLGVSFNSLGNVFDLESRRVKDGLSIIGLDLKKGLEESFTDAARLDDIIQALESSRIQEIPVSRVGVAYDGYDEAVSRFLQWVLTEGVKYNHAYGLLNLDEKTAEAQADKLKTEFTAQNK